MVKRSGMRHRQVKCKCTLWALGGCNVNREGIKIRISHLQGRNENNRTSELRAFNT